MKRPPQIIALVTFLALTFAGSIGASAAEPTGAGGCNRRHPCPTATPSPTPTVNPTPTPTVSPVNAKIIFGLGSQTESAIISPITQNAPIRILSNWYVTDRDLVWMTDAYHRSIYVDAYSRGYSLHLIDWSPEPEVNFTTLLGEPTCGRQYPLSARYLDDQRRLAQQFNGTGTIYVTLMTEFQTYPCVDNSWSNGASYYRALIDQYVKAINVWHTNAPRSKVSLGWGGWETQTDRSIEPFFVDALQASDFMSFQAMHGVSNVQASRDMTTFLGDYGPVMQAHHMPDADNNDLETVYRVFREDFQALFTTQSSVNSLVSDGLFAWQILDDKPLRNSTETYNLVLNSVRTYGQ